MGLDLDEIKAAVHAAAVSASGLGASSIIYARQDGPAPTLPYLTLFLSPAQKLGGTPIAAHEFNGAAPAGQEITERVGGPVRLTLTVEAFTAKSPGNAGALALLGKVKRRLFLPSIGATLRTAAGLTVEDAAEVLDISAVRHVGFEGRASLQVFLTTTEMETDTPVGYIATVGLVDLTGDAIIAPDGYNDGGA